MLSQSMTSGAKKHIKAADVSLWFLFMFAFAWETLRSGWGECLCHTNSPFEWCQKTSGGPYGSFPFLKRSIFINTAGCVCMYVSLNGKISQKQKTRWTLTEDICHSKSNYLIIQVRRGLIKKTVCLWTAENCVIVALIKQPGLPWNVLQMVVH